MDIYFKVDGGSEIGMGHIIRCIEFAKELKKKHDVYFICRKDIDEYKFKPGVNVIKENGFEVYEYEENDFYDLIEKIKVECIITDSYEIDEEYFKNVKEKVTISGCFDDEMVLEYYDVDFIINQNPYGNLFKYRANKNTKMLIGGKYTVLREEFKGENNKIINKNIKKLMVTVGGSDSNNFTEKILKEIIYEDYEVYVVIGPGFTDIDKLEKYKRPNINLCINPNMKELMLECDVCISSCGTTLYELASIGTPTLGIIIIENQKIAGNYFESQGAIRLTDIRDVKKELHELSFSTRRIMSEKLKNIIDGKGVVNLARDISTIFKQR